MATFVEQSDLEARVGLARVVELFDDDGDGVADAGAVAPVLARADAYARSVFYKKGFSSDQINLLTTDEIARGGACGVALGYAGERRAEWRNDRGEGPYEADKRDGKEILANIASGAQRSEVAGNKTNIRGRLMGPTPAFTFAVSKTNPSGSGGF